MARRLTQGEKSGRYRNLAALRILKKVDDELILEAPLRNVFLYHLHLLQVLEEARMGQLYTYHFALLRQLLEGISSFLGTSRVGRTLEKIGVQNESIDDVMNVINTHAHKSVYYDQTEMMNEAEQGYFNDIFRKLVEKYQFVF